MKYLSCVLAIIAGIPGWISCQSQAPTATAISNQALTVSLINEDTAFAVHGVGLEGKVFSARVGAEVDHQWLSSADYPSRKAVVSTGKDQLGPLHRIVVTLSGAAGRPDMRYSIELYDQLPFGDVQVELVNSGSANLTVQDIRVMDLLGPSVVNLQGAESADRVLSDSFSEDRPPLHIYDLGKAHAYEGEDSYSDSLTATHFAVGSQLIFNRTSGYSLFLAALSADKWVTLYHLATQPAKTGEVQLASYSVDCTGTTEVLKKESIRDSPPEQKIDLSLDLAPGAVMASEKVMFAFGKDYHAQLETYGQTVRQLRHALVEKPAPWGWWSWTAYYFGLSEGTALTNAEWLRRNLSPYGFDLFHIDEGNAYADGEFTTPNATLFPHGIRRLGYETTAKGLRFGIWVAPFRVSKRAYVYEKHPEWLVHDASGKPIQIGFVEGSTDPLFVLDTTHPGAQEYLRETYRTLVEEWNVRYFKADFMDDTAIEGYYYRPNTTAIEAEQIGLKIIRNAIGPDVLLDKDGSPMLPAVGYTDLGRISTDTGHSFAGMREDATGIAARYYMNGNFFQADPDAFTVSSQLITDQSWHTSKAPLSQSEAEVSIALAAVAGGMFEIGDDLPSLGTEPERLKLLTNSDLLSLMRLHKAMTPIDLMTYRAADGQPSVFFVSESKRQSMLAVFNWTDASQSHSFALEDLGLSARGKVTGTDIFASDRKVDLVDSTVNIAEQPPHSVRLIKLIDTAMEEEAPNVSMEVPAIVQAGQNAEFRAHSTDPGTPITKWTWEFGDGTGGDGPEIHHAYTRDGIFTVHLRVLGLDGKPFTRSATVKVEGSFKTTYQVEDYRRYGEEEGDVR